MVLPLQPSRSRSRWRSSARASRRRPGERRGVRPRAAARPPRRPRRPSPVPTGPTPTPSFVRPTPTPLPTFLVYVVTTRRHADLDRQGARDDGTQHRLLEPHEPPIAGPGFAGLRPRPDRGRLDPPAGPRHRDRRGRDLPGVGADPRSAVAARHRCARSMRNCGVHSSSLVPRNPPSVAATSSATKKPRTSQSWRS